MVKQHNLVEYGFIQSKREGEYALLGRYLVNLLEQIKENPEIEEHALHHLKNFYKLNDEKIKEMNQQLEALANDDSEPEEDIFTIMFKK